MNNEEAYAIVDNFSCLPWHDSQLLSWKVVNTSEDDSTVILTISFGMSNIVGRRAEFSFHHCRGVFADVDLLAKRLCGDQIASAYCELADESQSVFVNQLNDRFDLYPDESLAGLHVFGIELIHPSGRLIVMARSFSCRDLATE